MRMSTAMVKHLCQSGNVLSTNKHCCAYQSCVCFNAVYILLVAGGSAGRRRGNSAEVEQNNSAANNSSKQQQQDGSHNAAAAAPAEADAATNNNSAANKASADSTATPIVRYALHSHYIHMLFMSLRESSMYLVSWFH